MIGEVFMTGRATGKTFRQVCRSILVASEGNIAIYVAADVRHAVNMAKRILADMHGITFFHAQGIFRFPNGGRLIFSTKHVFDQDIDTGKYFGHDHDKVKTFFDGCTISRHSAFYVRYGWPIHD